MWPMLIMAALQSAQQAQKDKTANTVTAAKTRYSPWTGAGIGNAQQTADPAGNFGAAYAGYQAQQNQDARDARGDARWAQWLKAPGGGGMSAGSPNMGQGPTMQNSQQMPWMMQENPWGAS